MKKILFWLSFLVSTSLLLLPRWIERKFGNISLEPIEFALRTSLAGVNMSIVNSFVRNIVLTPMAILLVLLIISRAASRCGSIRRFFPKFLPVPLIIIYISLVIALLAFKYDLLNELTSRSSGSNFIEEHYTAVDFEDVEFPAVKKNLLLVIAESLENTFNDPALFNPILMPELLELQKDNISFTGHCPLPGTQWTIAGTTAYFFGLPLRLPIGKHLYGNLPAFLPNANSVLDILSQGGYDILLFLGSVHGFAGEGNLFKTHAPNAQIRDFLYFEERGAKRENGWGISDYQVLEGAKEYLEDVEEKGNREPFFLIIHTLDTHCSPVFVRDGDPRKFGDERDSFANLSRTLSNFIRWVEEKDFFENTSIVVLGDHWFMSKRVAGVGIEGEKRSLFNLFINASVPDGQVQNRPMDRRFSSMDMAPTILESIGVKINKPYFGLGKSLFSDGQTLLEEYGYERVLYELKRKSSFYHKLWGLAD